jgi:peroxiredoxin
MRSDNLYSLPQGLPVPVDDGASNHLWGMRIPSAPLLSTAGKWIDLSDSVDHTRVIYCYPRTGRPDQDPPGGIEEWNQIPGARGCTPQAIGFREHFPEFQALGVELYGLSTQSTSYQQEAVTRLNLPFELLSDDALVLTKALALPTFVFGSATLNRRLTMIIESGIIVKVYYPVFPPDSNAADVIAWLIHPRKEN